MVHLRHKIRKVLINGLLVIGIVSMFLATPAYADIFSGQVNSGYLSIGSTSISGSYLIIGTSSTNNSYLSIGLAAITAPSIQANNATSITMTSARLNAIVLSDGGDSNVSARFGIGITSQTAANFSNYTYISSWVAGYHTNSLVFIDRGSLGANTTYYYRVQVMNSHSTNVTSANEITFTTIATLGNVLNLRGVPTSNSIILTWAKASGSTNTTIRYRTDAYPVSPTDGTSVYSGTGYQCTVSSLIPGQVYYFSAWGKVNPDSTIEDHLALSTLAVDIPSGAARTATNIIPIPTLPTTIDQPASIPPGSNFEPFTTIINYFVTAPGGLGMPIGNAWEMLAVLAVVVSGMGTYVKLRNFFVAFFVVLVLTVIFVGLHLMQAWLVPIEIVIGLGVWAVDKYFQ